MSMAEDRKTDPDVGRRLRVLRAAFGINGFNTNQNAFAAQLGIAHTTYNNYESGYPVPRPKIKQIALKLQGVTIDWLYSGRTDTLSVGLARRLEEVEAALLTNDKRRVD